MADHQVSHQPCKQFRAEIDTTLPFRSVKAAVSLFDDKAEVKKFRLPEKHISRDLEVQQLKEELAHVKLQLIDTEDAKERVCAELRDSKKLIEGMVRGSEDNEMGRVLGSEKNKEVDGYLKSSSRSLNDEAEKHGVWEVKLKIAQWQHTLAVAELNSARRDLEMLQQELVSYLKGEENASRQAQVAITSTEFNARKVEGSRNEISGTNKFSELVEARKERTAPCVGKLRNDAEDTINVQVMHLWEQDIQELEHKLATATEELFRLHQELTTAKEAEDKVAKDASKAFANLEHAKLELEKTRMLASNSCISANAFFSELDMAKQELEKALENGDALQATMDALQSELEIMRRELGNLREREANASAAVETLTRELWKTKFELIATNAAEAKSNDSIVGLSQASENITAEPDEVKVNAMALKEQAGKAKTDVDRANAAMTITHDNLRIALKAAEAAKASESSAFERLKDLCEKASVAKAEGAEASIAVSHERYDMKEAREDEKLANMGMSKVDTLLIEAVKASGLDLQQTLAQSDVETEETLRSDAESEISWRGDSELVYTSLGMERDWVNQKEYQRLEVQRENGTPSPNNAQSVESVTHLICQRAVGQKKKKKQHLLPSLITLLVGKKTQTTHGL